MAKNDSLYHKAVQITEEYLGPAGERFLRRQIETHLQIAPEQLKKKNMPKLINWVSIAFAVITQNKKELDAFTHDLEALTRSGQ